MAFCESYAAGKKVSELKDMASGNRGWGSGSGSEFGDLVAVGEKVFELHDLELESEKSETKIGGNLSCRLSVVYKRVVQFRSVEFEAEAKKLKLTTDDEYADDDDVYPCALLYDRVSKDKDVEPGETFVDLANLAVDAFIERCVDVDRANLVKLVRVSSVDSNGVLLHLMMTANLRDNFVSEWEDEDQTLEALVWYGGRDSKHIKYDVLTVQVWHREVETDDQDAELDDHIESESEVESDEEEQEQAVNEQFFMEFAELAMDDFNNSNPHIPYQVLSLLKVTESFRSRFIVYTIRMTAKLKPPHDAKSNAPPVQTFRAVIYHECDPSQPTVLSITIADPS